IARNNLVRARRQRGADSRWISRARRGSRLSRTTLMHRLLFGTCALALLLAAGIRADDEKKKEEQKKEEQKKEEQKKEEQKKEEKKKEEKKKEEKKKEEKPAEVYKAVMQEARKDYFAAKSEQEKQKVLKACAGKLLNLAENNPKDPAALQALLTVVAG